MEPTIAQPTYNMQATYNSTYSYDNPIFTGANIPAYFNSTTPYNSLAFYDSIPFGAPAIIFQAPFDEPLTYDSVFLYTDVSGVASYNNGVIYSNNLAYDTGIVT